MDKIKRILKGYLIGLILFGILSILGAVILKITPFPEKWEFFYLLSIMMVCCIFTAFYISSYFQKAGLLCGLGFSAGLVLLILIITAGSFGEVVGLDTFTPMYFIPLAGGIAGGIGGANRKN